jgi:hypothetical protein
VLKCLDVQPYTSLHQFLHHYEQSTDYRAEALDCSPILRKQPMGPINSIGSHSSRMLSTSELTLKHFQSRICQSSSQGLPGTL